MPPGTTRHLQHTVHLLERMARRARTDDRHQKPMSAGARRVSKPLEMAIFVQRFIGFSIDIPPLRYWLERFSM